jgi:hypothetical protein
MQLGVRNETGLFGAGGMAELRANRYFKIKKIYVLKLRAMNRNPLDCVQSY